MEQNYQVLERAQQKPAEWQTWNEVEVISAAYGRPRFANWTLLRSVKWSEERKTWRMGWNYPSCWRGRQEIHGISSLSAPPSQKIGFEQSDRGITASERPLLQAWRWHRSKQGRSKHSRNILTDKGVGKQECSAKARAVLPCVKPLNALLTPVQATVVVPMCPTAPALNVTCPKPRAEQAASNLFSFLCSI